MWAFMKDFSKHVYLRSIGNGIGMKDRFQEYGRVGVFMLEEGKIPLGALQSSNRHCSMNDSCTFLRD